MNVPVEKFGKDHWSLLGYIETVVVDFTDDGVGKVVHDRMRCNSGTHPELLGPRQRMASNWEPAYGTRLRGFFEDKSRHLPDHDDWDCLKDLEATGFLVIIDAKKGSVKLTEGGIKVAQELRTHKINGGNFSNFVPTFIPTPKPAEELELKVGATYRARHPHKLQNGELNDREVVYMDEFRVQYDGPAVHFGQRYPAVSVQKFRKWAGKEVEEIVTAGG